MYDRVGDFLGQTCLSVTPTYEWYPYEGTLGGAGWKSAKTGRVAYQKDRPGSHEHDGPSDVEPTGGTARPAPAGAAMHDPVGDRLAAKPKSGEPGPTLARALAEGFRNGHALDADALFEQANHAWGGTRAEAAYGQSQAYDAMEAGFNQALAGETNPRASLAEAIHQAKGLAEQVAALPTQTNRSGNKDALQQFSTPPHYSYAVNWLANLHPGDVVLEPSAGTGCLATHAVNAGADVYANELDPERAEYLKDQLGEDKVFVGNAEQIAAVLPGQMPEPTAIVMNPPFSQTAGRMGDAKDLLEGAKHIEEAMLMLADGGRLVAIVGKGMKLDAARYRDWFDKMKGEYTLRANVGVDGDEYKKYGTHFGTRVLVFDKTGPHAGETVTGDAADIPDLMTKLEGVRNDRPQLAGRAPGERAGGVLADGATGSAGDAAAAAAAGVAGPAGAGFAGEPNQRAEGRGLPSAVGAGGGSGGADGGQPGGLAAAPVGESAAGVAGARPGAAPPAADAPGKRKGKRGKSAGGKSAKQPPAPLQLKPARELTVEPVAADDKPKGEAASQADLGDSLYESYRPQRMRVAGAQPHVSAMVESAAMSAVAPPPPVYKPSLSPDIVEKGILSEVQLEPVLYAGQAHENFLEAAEGEPAFRQGYALGDGTGSGKGRVIAGIMADNVAKGRLKHVWLTKNDSLYKAALRDWVDLGHDPAKFVKFSDLRDHPEAVTDGCVFIPYDTLKSRPDDESLPSNLETLTAWLGKDFDGVIAFDESHLLSNSIETNGARGKKDASARAIAGMDLQNAVPKARVLYSSATGATEVSNLAYMQRLGIWGRGTGFPGGRDEFINHMEQGGVAAMEGVAQSLKATGHYCARSLSMDGVTHERVTHHLDEDQTAQYDALANGWQVVLQNIDKALELTGGAANGKAKSAASGQFWGAQQRFFNQVMTSMQMPSVLKAMEKDIADGKAPVLQFVNTNEAAMKRALATREEGEDLEQLDLSPREALTHYLNHCFPTHRYEEYKDADGHVRTRLVTKDVRGPDGKPVKGPDGKVLQEPVEDPRAVKIREEMLDMVGTLAIPSAPMDMVHQHFQQKYKGKNVISEVTGRSIRKVLVRDEETGKLKETIEKRGSRSNAADVEEFMNGDNVALMFSGAGNTGADYHASRKVSNQKQRVHYCVQPGWRADEATQGFGRTHRTNQSSAPIYKLVEIAELPGQRRFVSSIARRLDQMGALTRGQREAGSSGMFKAADNLESHEAGVAMERFFTDLSRGAVPGLNHVEVMAQLGFKPNKEGKIEGPSDMPQFMNRMLALNVGLQAKVFDAYSARLNATVEQAIADNTLDSGVENYPADKIEKTNDRVIFRDPKSGAEAQHITTMCYGKRQKRQWKQNEEGQKPLFYARNKRSGQVWAVFKGANKTDTESGKAIPHYFLRGPVGSGSQPVLKVDGGGYERLNAEDAKPLWNDEYKASPDYDESEQHFVTGALLPVWDRIPGDKPRYFRLRTQDGKTVVGRHVPAALVPDLERNLGVVSSATKTMPNAAELHEHLLKNRESSAALANGWKLKPVMVQYEKRIELTGPGISHLKDLEADGIDRVRIDGKTRLFVPVGEEGRKVMERITKNRPIVDVEGTLAKKAPVDRVAAILESAPAPAGATDEVAVMQEQALDRSLNRGRKEMLENVEDRLRAVEGRVADDKGHIRNVRQGVTHLRSSNVAQPGDRGTYHEIMRSLGELEAMAEEKPAPEPMSWTMPGPDEKEPAVSPVEAKAPEPVFAPAPAGAATASEPLAENHYRHNPETDKLELHFNKAMYQGLSPELKQQVKSNFLWAPSRGAWVSRAKGANTVRAAAVAQRIGLQDASRISKVSAPEVHDPVGAFLDAQAAPVPAPAPEPVDTEADYREFARKYKAAFKSVNKYTPDQVGMHHYADEMAKLADAHPDWAERAEQEDAPAPKGLPSLDEIESLKPFTIDRTALREVAGRSQYSGPSDWAYKEAQERVRGQLYTVKSMVDQMEAAGMSDDAEMPDWKRAIDVAERALANGKMAYQEPEPEVEPEPQPPASTEMYTSAPEAYDGFGTKTLAVVGRDRQSGNPVRKVAVENDHMDWQTQRYGSGMHRFTHPQTPLEHFVKFGDWELHDTKPAVVEPEVSEPEPEVSLSPADRVNEIADQWYHPDGNPRTRILRSNQERAVAEKYGVTTEEAAALIRAAEATRPVASTTAQRSLFGDDLGEVVPQHKRTKRKKAASSQPMLFSRTATRVGGTVEIPDRVGQMLEKHFNDGR